MTEWSPNVCPTGAGYKVIEVVKGTEDVYVHTTLIKKWDICAGDAILRAIGGTQTDLLGNDINYSHNLNPKNEHGLIATMHDHDKYRVALKDAAKLKWSVSISNLMNIRFFWLQSENLFVFTFMHGIVGGGNIFL